MDKENGTIWTETQGIKGTAKRCKAENMGITEYQLRKAIAAGDLPVRKPGGCKSVLIYWPNVLRWARCEDGQDNTPPSGGGGIRPVC